MITSLSVLNQGRQHITYETLGKHYNSMQRSLTILDLELEHLKRGCKMRLGWSVSLSPDLELTI